MSGALSPQAQQKVAELRLLADRIQHVYGMVERFATTRDETQARMLSLPLKRAFGKLKADLLGAGFDTMSQLAASMEIAAGRGGNFRNKARILREGIGSLRFQMDQEIRKTISDDQRAQAAADSANVVDGTEGGVEPERAGEAADPGEAEAS